MSHSHKLSFWAALLINVNIMLGTGIFINPVNLFKISGFLGVFSYLLVALMLCPLIISIAGLLKKFPSGGFYIYGAHSISPFVGFVSAWAYFIGKIASATLLIHVCSSLLRTIIPALHVIPPLMCDAGIIMLFAGLNLFNLRTGMRLIYGFIGLKLFPILFAIIGGLWLLFNGGSAPVMVDWSLWQGVPLTLPLVLYAFAGFEASCSLSAHIQDAERNAPKAVLYSFAIVVCLLVLYQLLLSLSLGSMLGAVENFLSIFPLFTSYLLPHSQAVGGILVTALHIAIASSALSGAYGILFSTHWNLYALAEHNHLFASERFLRLNRYNIPTWCVGAEVLLCLGYIVLTAGAQMPLQQLASLGTTITYAISVASLWALCRRTGDYLVHPLIIWAALGSCAIFIVSCIRNFMVNGIVALAGFTILLLIGMLMYVIRRLSAHREF